MNNLLHVQSSLLHVCHGLTVNLCRRELDNSEAERAQHLSQIRDLQEHIQEKESQILALQEEVDASILFPIFLNLSLMIEICLLFGGIETYPDKVISCVNS